MSKQLTLSATLSVFAMMALTLATALTAPTSSSAGGDGATAHGSLVKVLVRG